MGSLRNFRVVVNGQAYQVEVEEIEEASQSHGSAGTLESRFRDHEARPEPPGFGTVEGEQVVAPLPGVVLEVRVVEGEQVEAGQVLLVLEAMKMENEVVAPCAGRVAGIRVEAGTVVNVGDLLLALGS